VVKKPICSSMVVRKEDSWLADIELRIRTVLPSRLFGRGQAKVVTNTRVDVSFNAQHQVV